MRRLEAIVFALVFLIFNAWFISILEELSCKLAILFFVICIMIGAIYFAIHKSKGEKSKARNST